MVNIFRFNLSDEVICSIKHFVDYHFDKDSKQFKEIWEIWYNNNDLILIADQKRLSLLGYVGDYRSKVYTASRYYFKNKIINKKYDYQKDIICESKKRTYIMFSLEFIELIHYHIKNFKNYNKSPAEAFNNFCQDYSNDIDKELRNVLENYSLLSSEIILNKIKKSYKNLFYQYNKVN